MVSRRALDSIAAALRSEGRDGMLADLALRSRLGKGACQGTFCAVRVIAHRYEQGALSGEAGLREQCAFFRERWRRQHAVVWGEQLAQVELAEAIHCGLHGYERTGQGGAPMSETYDVAVIGTGLAGMSASVFAANRGLRVVQVGNAGALLFSSGLLDLLGVHPIEEGPAWGDPWAGLAVLTQDLPPRRPRPARGRSARGRTRSASAAPTSCRSQPTAARRRGRFT